MRIGACDVCVAKDAELQHLRALNKALTDKIIAMVDPGMEARAAREKRLAEQPPPEKRDPPRRASASFLRRTMRDGGPGPGWKGVSRETAAQVEESFKVKQ